MKTNTKAEPPTATSRVGTRTKRTGPDAEAAFSPVTEEALAALDALGKEGVWRIGDDELKLTNLDKPLFQPRTAVEGEPRLGEGPDAKPITKRELIGYYARIAPYAAPPP